MSTWQEGKAAHIALSDAAAPKYDDIYEASNFATGSYMQYEHDLLLRAISLVPSTNLALDLGCGTGRHTFLLGKQFKQVIGYDFSGGMLDEALKTKLRKRSGNCLLQKLDIEQERLPASNASVGLVTTGFGMGSFLESPEELFREVRRVLVPEGVAIFSFYNRDALVNQLTLPWTPALAARVKPGADVLEVNFEGTCHEIAAKAYGVAEIRDRLQGNFIVQELSTFPTLSALFPQELFASLEARKLCTQVDRLLAGNLDVAAGPYIVALCRKKGRYDPPVQHGYARAVSLLDSHGLQDDIVEHEPVSTMEDVARVLSASPEQMVKSVLVAVDSWPGGTAVPNPPLTLVLAAIPATKKLDRRKLATILSVSYKSIRFATQEEVEDLTGFKIGSIPPFGMPRQALVFLDSRFQTFQHVWCGTGKRTESLKISLQDLCRISSASFADISRDA